MIHFDFTVTDEEASAIFEELKDAINEASECARGGVCQHDTDTTEEKHTDEEKQWFKARADYLSEIIEKMKNTAA
jgi:ArsR family metal-binding transcriptional regulator